VGLGACCGSRSSSRGSVSSRPACDTRKESAGSVAASAPRGKWHLVRVRVRVRMRVRVRFV
jgi:hypothetical protein